MVIIMAGIIKTFKEDVPAMRFIGKKYDNFTAWGEFFENGWFDKIEEAMGGVDAILKIWENGGGYIGLECRRCAELLEYWIGMFPPAGTEVPAGFDFIDFPESTLGTCWIYGEEKDVHRLTKGCSMALSMEGIEMTSDKTKLIYSFENCLCPRYTTPDEKGNVTLDYCHYL